MKMLTPRLRSIGTLQVQTRELNSDNEYELTWTDWLANEPIEIVWLSGRDFVQSAELQKQIVARITMRWRPGVLNTMRWTVDGSIYKIVALLPDSTGRQWITIMVSAGVGDGA